MCRRQLSCFDVRLSRVFWFHSVDCVSRLAGCIKYMDDMPATRSVGVRLLGRILGKNLTLLLQAVAGRNARGEPCSDEEIAFSASLLASLSLDDETVETLMFQRHVYREAEVGIVPDNSCPETIVSLIKSVHIPDAVVSMMDVARCLGRLLSVRPVFHRHEAVVVVVCVAGTLLSAPPRIAPS
jgi:hypothetical protein